MYKEELVKVEEILYEDERIQLLVTSDGAKRAMLYKNICPSASVGERLIVNHTAASLSLGTGGWDIVQSVVRREPFQNEEGKGHIMKARYLPSQLSVLSIEAQESEYHDIFKRSFSLDEKPILLAELHSMIPIVYTSLKARANNMTLTIIISDEASIPIVMSEHLRVMKQDPLIKTISIGQAFGGDMEAVNLQTALQYAHEIMSDVILVTLGPGVVGTGTKYGYSGMVLAQWANIVGKLGGKPVWIPRISFADQRERHVGISHHTLTPLVEFTYATSYLPIPILQESERVRVEEQLTALKDTMHQVVPVSLDDAFISSCQTEMDNYPLPIKTMGRTYYDDRAFFHGVYAAIKSLSTLRPKQGDFK